LQNSHSQHTPTEPTNSPFGLFLLAVTHTYAQHPDIKKSQSHTLCVEDLLPSYLLCSLHAMLNQEQWMLGTHRLLLPVSKMT
jgi:hypothetical protein